VEKETVKGEGKNSESEARPSEVSEARMPRPEVLRGGILGRRPSRRVAKGVRGYD